MLKSVSYLATNMFTPIGYIATEGWREERNGEKTDTCNALLSAEFEELFITERSTDMELSGIVSLLLWETKEFSFGERELGRLEMVKLLVLS